MILAGDIGGTSTRLALVENRQGRLVTVRGGVFSSAQYPGLSEIADAFVRKSGERVDAACFGIAGPVQHGRVVTPNLPWIVEGELLARDLGLPAVKLLNDLEANAYGIAALAPEDFVTLNAGALDASGNAAVISVGTGLGEAGLFWDGRIHLPFACEGGHADFAPRNALETELLLWLQQRHERVSYERVLSGPGLLAIYEFLRDTRRGLERAETVRAMENGDKPALISAAALEGRDDLCIQALDLFVSLYGAEAGNLALRMMATGGIYIGGGVAPRILPKLKTPAFMSAFMGKGRMQSLLEAVPVKVIVKDTAALLGAARVAAFAEQDGKSSGDQGQHAGRTAAS
jgi:glucokinase